MSTIITNNNIETLVETYINRYNNLPSNLQKPIGQWNVENVTNMAGLFEGREFNEPIGQWNVKNVTNMSRMFHNCLNFNQEIGEWDVGRVTSMESSSEGVVEVHDVFIGIFYQRYRISVQRD